MTDSSSSKLKSSKKTLSNFSSSQILWSFVGSFIGIYLISASNLFFQLSIIDHLFLVGSFGASAVLIFGTPRIPYAQPRNLVGGHILSAIIGVTIFQLLPFDLAITSALAVSLSIVVMQLTGTVHPPGGATALIAVIGSSDIHQLGYWYVLTPIGFGVSILLLIAVMVNNLSKDPMRKYPTHWF